mmetsp:Transcript_7444/g.16256  ORF Transcript_7444/g.16256 Transcript_7444/m.16256 type:complete len:339 (-) Transcript_7444:15-1031(-)|eukprot:CAMPEP_0172552252 /NCGR_PEP_ID=MMETSP1067-20121228/43715_1 /TAXON_ID=265564 ORGANISM="Thalassiosira punctigera, Strain Tpunct2005C2" /NCGR_SAMPLE_ID=MMETSP1067 /ASSEMBLY_ACC=CAM_ASM_000444 /LENGTH=338 /DNA_ID=CAMNT_0013340185 /DNA_START=32 /DNA_END=1048 /DNA_ORIENTATION=-
MAPYAPSFDSYNTSSGNCNQEEVIFSLTERLREREAEIRHIRQEKSELENQLLCRAKPKQRDAAYEDLLSHLKRREKEFRSDSKKQEETQRDLERENRRLNDKVLASRKLLDDREKKLSLIERENDGDLERMRERLHVIMDENEEKNRRIMILEDMVDGLTIEAGQHKKRESEDQSLLTRLGERVESYRHGLQELERANEDLQNRVDTQRHLLKEKETKILEMERYRNQREDELNDDIDRMRRIHNDFVDSQRVVLEDREEEIHLLHRQCEKYEGIIDKAEYVTYEQRADLKAKKREIEGLSMAIEKVQNSGLFGQLDTICTSSKSVFLGNTPADGSS